MCALRFAVNYSPQVAGLLQAGVVAFDLFKTPPWPDMVARARKLAPVTVHFPFGAGAGEGDALDTHRNGPPDWHEVERWLQETETRYINLHLTARCADFPHIPAASLDPAHVAEVSEAMLRDVEAVVRRWGAERVIVENDHGWNEKELRLCALPQVIGRVVEDTGCGLLFDFAHARLAARRLHIPTADYLAALPLSATREIHITGIQYLPAWALARLQAADISPERLARSLNRPLDHLPLTEADWPWMHWLAERLAAGKLGDPWLVALECGGAGPYWQAITDQQALARQIPRLVHLLRM